MIDAKPFVQYMLLLLLLHAKGPYYVMILKKKGGEHVASFLNFPPNPNVEYLQNLGVLHCFRATTLTPRVVTNYNFNDPNRFRAYASDWAAKAIQ